MMKGFKNTPKNGCIQDMRGAATVIIQIKFDQAQEVWTYICNAVWFEVLSASAGFVFLFYPEDGSVCYSEALGFLRTMQHYNQEHLSKI
jgi:hypothetical protein